jgi:predicted nucleic acid-binding protein
VAELLLDTDVLIDHLRGHRRLLAGADNFAYSVLTAAELWAGASADEAILRPLLASMREVPLTRQMAELAGSLRRKHKIPLADAVIAATALSEGLELLSRNQRHYAPVPGLRLRKP